MSSESDLNYCRQFLVAVNDLLEFWDKFVFENYVMLEALGEDQGFSSLEESEANRMIVSAKTLASRLSSLNISDEPSVLANIYLSDVAGHFQKFRYLILRGIWQIGQIFGIGLSHCRSNI